MTVMIKSYIVHRLKLVMYELYKEKSQLDLHCCILFLLSLSGIIRCIWL